MRTSRNKGFTLVEILIVVVILGILAAIVVPQFTNASQEALKSSLRTQLQTISSQIELYRVQNAGQLPHQVVTFPAGPASGTPTWSGWGILVEQSFLKSEPSNGYTRTRTIVGDTFTPNPPTDGNAAGWVYNTTSGIVAANGYNHDENILASDDATLNGWSPWAVGP